MDIDGDGIPDKRPSYVTHAIYIAALMTIFILSGAFLGHATYNLFLGDGTKFPRDIAIGVIASLITIAGADRARKRKPE